MGFAIFDAAFGGDTNYATQAANQESKRQLAIQQGTIAIDDAFKGFTPDFYKQRAKSYQDFALPQLMGQYQQTRNQVGYDLANRNLIGGSAAQSRWSDLNRSMSDATQRIADTGISQAQQLMGQVEGARNQQIQNLYQSADPAQAAKSATSTAASFTIPNAFPALANQFNSLLNQYYTSQLINAYRPTSYIQAPQDSGAGSQAPVTISTRGY